MVNTTKNSVFRLGAESHYRLLLSTGKRPSGEHTAKIDPDMLLRFHLEL
jgi:hypothetical protein